MKKTVQDGAFGKFVHSQQPVAIDARNVIRMNRGTLYFEALFDLDAGPVTLELPDTAPTRTARSASCAGCSSWPKCGATVPAARTLATLSRCIPTARPPISSATRTWGGSSASSTSWRQRGWRTTPFPQTIRLQFAGRRSEIVGPQWDWVDLENRRVIWPDSKTGGRSKPLSEEAHRLLSTAPRREDCPHVLPSPGHPGQS